MTYHVFPGACASRVRALEAREHVDEDTAVVLEVRRALAVAAAAKAGERDLLGNGPVRLAGVAEEPPWVEDADERREREGER